ncbi:MAG TPA: hypothetical protein VFA44_13950 [Gaiellaceae bacterium]|nr:hypothetical protein [Gaiellaceae bacterium]HZT53796.1 hypothetical protein [Gaiellaceae bacterium]
MQPEIEIADGTVSELAALLRDAVAAALERHPERAATLRALRERVLVRAEDTGEVVTLVFADGRVSIADGDAGGARIRILGDRDAISALTRVPLRRGLPDLRSEATRTVLLRQLGGELTVRGLIVRGPHFRRVLQLLAAGA